MKLHVQVSKYEVKRTGRKPNPSPLNLRVVDQLSSLLEWRRQTQQTQVRVKVNLNSLKFQGVGRGPGRIAQTIHILRIILTYTHEILTGAIWFVRSCKMGRRLHHLFSVRRGECCTCGEIWVPDSDPQHTQYTHIGFLAGTLQSYLSESRVEHPCKCSCTMKLTLCQPKQMDTVIKMRL